MPPPGGPQDTIPPSILLTEPENFTTNFRGKEVRIQFSEDVLIDRSGEILQLFPPDPYTVRWKSRKVLEIRFDTLREKQTYLLTLLPTIRDEEGNALPSPYTLVFSTGDSISKGEISGRIYGNVEDFPVRVFLSADTLSWEDTSWFRSPTYQLVAGRSGEFRFPALAAGKYRIAAYRDRNGNHRYDPGSEAAATAWRDVDLQQEERVQIDLWIPPDPDLMPPRIIGVTPLTTHRIRIRFSEPIDTLSITNNAFSVRSVIPEKTEVWKPIGVGIEPGKETAVIALFEISLAESEWILWADTVIRDRAGNPLDTAGNSARFHGNTSPDTLFPEFGGFPISDSSQILTPTLRWVFSFSSPMDTSEKNPVVCTVASDSSPVPILQRWKSQTHLEITAKEELRYNTWYQLRISDSLADVLGRKIRNPERIRFRTPDPRDFGTIEGEIRTQTLQGPFLLRAEGKAYRIRYELYLPTAGMWKISNVLPDLYRIFVFEDRNQNHLLDSGSLFPYSPGEYFLVHEQEIRVRPRWETAGIILSFP